MGLPLAKLQATTGAINYAGVKDVLQLGVQERLFPGAVCIVAKGDPFGAYTTPFQGVVGNFSFSPLEGQDELQAVSKGSVYDIDSLTSRLITTTIAMKAIEEGRIKLTDRISRHMHGFGVFGKSPLRIEDILRHESGLPLSEDFYLKVDSLRHESAFGTPIGRGVAQHVQVFINRITPKASVGQLSQYGAIEMLLLGALLEDLWAKRIDELGLRFVLQPLGIRSSGFIDHGLVQQGKVELDTSAVAPSILCPWRKRTLQGEVCDENTWAMGGISGESGLFATAKDVTTILQGLLASYHGFATIRTRSRASKDTNQPVSCPRTLVSRSIVRDFFALKEGHRGQALGWSSCHSAFGATPPSRFEKSLGAVSSTGCGVWFDPESGLSLTFLSNGSIASPRLPQGAQAGRGPKKLASFWPKLLNAVWSRHGERD